jgi:hypothetical protein
VTDEIPDAELVALHVDRDGMEFTMRHPIVRDIAEQLCAAFREARGVNFVSWEITTEGLGPMTLTMRRGGGRTPEFLASRYREALECIAIGGVDPVGIARGTLAAFGEGNE